MKSIKSHPKLTESKSQLIEVKGPVIMGIISSLAPLFCYLCAQRGLIPTTATRESLLRQPLLWGKKKKKKIIFTLETAMGVLS